MQNKSYTCKSARLAVLRSELLLMLLEQLWCTVIACDMSVEWVRVMSSFVAHAAVFFATS